MEVDDAPDSPSTQRWGGTTHRVFKLADWHATLYAWPWAGRSATAWAAEELERPDARPPECQPRKIGMRALRVM